MPGRGCATSLAIAFGVLVVLVYFGNRLFSYESQNRVLMPAVADSFNRMVMLQDENSGLPRSNKWHQCSDEEIAALPNADAYNSCAVFVPIEILGECSFWWAYRRCIGVVVDSRFENRIDADELAKNVCRYMVDPRRWYCSKGNWVDGWFGSVDVFLYSRDALKRTKDLESSEIGRLTIR